MFFGWINGREPRYKKSDSALKIREKTSGAQGKSYGQTVHCVVSVQRKRWTHRRHTQTNTDTLSSCRPAKHTITYTGTHCGHAHSRTP